MRYKVQFKNNIAVLAMPIDPVRDRFPQLSDYKDGVIIKYLFVDASGTTEAMELANKIASDLWGERLGFNG